MSSAEDWAQIRRLRRSEGLPIKVIARTLKISKNTVKSALADEAPPKYERPPRGSIVDEVEPRIRELLQVYPTMPATVIAERIGWTRSIRVLSARVAELRPVYLPPDPASRTAYVAGEIAQCDLWFPDVAIPVGFGQTRTATRLPVLTMISAYSRWLMAVLIPSRGAEDLFAGWWQLIEQLGSVPRALVWDGEGAIGRWRAGRAELTAECQAFRGVLAAKVIVCRPADPEARVYYNRAESVPDRRPTRRTRQVPRDRDEWIPIECPRIISDELSQAAGRVATENTKWSPRRAEPGQWLLKGLVKCGVCGVGTNCHKMRGRNGTWHRYYYCRNHDPLRAGGESRRCPERNIRADALDTFVFDHIRAAITRPDLLLAGEQAAAVRTPIPDDELLSAELARLDRKIDAADTERRRLIDLYQDRTPRNAPPRRRNRIPPKRAATQANQPR